jgi:hypothetical protein
LCCLSDVLTPLGLDQAVYSVIGVIPIRPDNCPFKVNRLLGIIADGCDIADGVVGVGKVLQSI